ncbi:MAG: hypothetical protein V1716_00080 [Candidatus Uhrbacteria bacterium]
MSNNQTATRRVVEISPDDRSSYRTRFYFRPDGRRAGEPYVMSVNDAAMARRRKAVELGHIELTPEERWNRVESQVHEMAEWYLRVRTDRTWLHLCPEEMWWRLRSLRVLKSTLPKGLDKAETVVTQCRTLQKVATDFFEATKREEEERWEAERQARYEHEAALVRSSLEKDELPSTNHIDVLHSDGFISDDELALYNCLKAKEEARQTEEHRRRDEAYELARRVRLAEERRESTEAETFHHKNYRFAREVKREARRLENIGYSKMDRRASINRGHRRGYDPDQRKLWRRESQKMH